MRFTPRAQRRTMRGMIQAMIRATTLFNSHLPCHGDTPLQPLIGAHTLLFTTQPLDTISSHATHTNTPTSMPTPTPEHSTAGKGYIDALRFSIGVLSNKDADSARVRLFSLSLINGALGDQGQNYMNLKVNSWGVYNHHFRYFQLLPLTSNNCNSRHFRPTHTTQGNRDGSRLG